MKRSWCFLLLTLVMVSTFAQDTTGLNGKAGVADVAEEDPGLFMVMMLILVAVIVAAFMAIFIATIIFLFLVAMAVAGIVSISTLMGFYHRSVGVGIRWLVYLSFAMVGIGGGALAYWLFTYFDNSAFEWQSLFVYAIPAGLLGGLLAAWISLFFMKTVIAFVKRKLLPG